MARAWLLGTAPGATDRPPRAVLVAVRAQDGGGLGTGPGSDTSLGELRRLADTDGLAVVDAVVQARPRPDPATYLGAGKVDELGALVEQTGADLVIADGELSPGQARNLEDRVPELLVLNKVDVAPPERLAELRRAYPDALAVSARTGEGIDELREALAARLEAPS